MGKLLIAYGKGTGKVGPFSTTECRPRPTIGLPNRSTRDNASQTDFASGLSFDKIHGGSTAVQSVQNVSGHRGESSQRTTAGYTS